MGLLLYYALTILMVLVLARIVLSWFPPGGSTMQSIQGFVFASTEWLMGPLPLVVLLVIGVLRGLVV